jgi:hypothetical protein
MDIQVLINGEGRNVTSYTVKYTFKPQKVESTVIMKMGVLTKSVEKVIRKNDNEEISAMERGKRIINSVLYAFTKPVEVPATIAAFALIRGSLYVMSHEFSYIKLDACAACYPNRLIRGNGQGTILTTRKRKYQSILHDDEDEDEDDDHNDDGRWW